MIFNAFYLSFSISLGLISIISSFYIFKKNKNNMLIYFILFTFNSLLHISFAFFYIFNPEINNSYSLFNRIFAFCCDLISIFFFITVPLLLLKIIKKDKGQKEVWGYLFIFLINFIFIFLNNLILLHNEVSFLTDLIFVCSLSLTIIHFFIFILLKKKNIYPKELRLFFWNACLASIILYPAMLIRDYFNLQIFSTLIPTRFIFAPSLFIIWNLLSIIYFIKYFIIISSNFLPLEIPEDFSKAYNISKREKEVFILIMSGKSYKEITEKLFISINTVKKHITHIYQKIGVNNKVAAFNKIKHYLSK